ncbi:MAG: immunity protein YezG family protein [Veillonella atypica]|uniref:immunity protein YezG family protein n=1 Tax=Veillonella atypica TaxID=39777 RepID=UPI003995157F
MDRYINKIRDILIECMPKHWYKAYLYFDSTETGSMTSAEYYVKTPAGSIISYGDLLYNCSTEKVNSINNSIDEILVNVRSLHDVSVEPWTWGTMYISRDDYEPHCEFHNDPVTDEYWLQNRYKWEYQNFGVLAREDEFEPDVYKEMIKGPRGVLLLEDMESRILAKNYTAIDKAFRLEHKSLEDELEKHYNALAKKIYKLTPLDWGFVELNFESRNNSSSVELSIYRADNTLISRYVEENNDEPVIISEIMSDLKHEILDMIETFKFYNQNPFSSMVYTLTSEGQLSLDFSYDNK